MLSKAADARRAKLFEPLRVRGLEIDNRFVMAPMTRSFCPDGAPPPKVAAYYERRALGGVGLIITEGVGIPHPAALGLSEVDGLDVPHMFGRSALEAWKVVVERVHNAGGKIAPQLWHQGPIRKPGTGPYPNAPVARPSGLWGPQGRATMFSSSYLSEVAQATTPMSDKDIQDVIDAYAEAARNAARLGFDAIAIHGAHGYLIDAFLWAETNRRQDRWGGATEERAAFAAAIVAAIRREVGEDLPIIFRFSQWKQQDFRARIAQTPEELARLLGPITDAGADIFDASVRYFNHAAFDGAATSLAGWAKRVTGKYSLTVGGVGLGSGMLDSARDGIAPGADNIDLVLDRFERNEFDLVGVGRALLHDPEFVERVRNGAPLLGYHEQSRRVLR